MSQEDKDHEYVHCCYEEIRSLKVCTFDTEESYKEEMELINELRSKDNIVYKCDGKDNKGSFINISIIVVISIVLNI